MRINRNETQTMLRDHVKVCIIRRRKYSNSSCYIFSPIFNLTLYSSISRTPPFSKGIQMILIKLIRSKDELCDVHH